MVDGILLFALGSPITWSPTSKLGADNCAAVFVTIKAEPDFQAK